MNCDYYGAGVTGATVVGTSVVGTSVVGATVVGATVVGASVVGATVVGEAVVGMTVVVAITDEQPTAGRIMSSHVGSFGWKHKEPSALVYIPKQTGIVCQSLQ